MKQAFRCRGSYQLPVDPRSEGLSPRREADAGRGPSHRRLAEAAPYRPSATPPQVNADQIICGASRIICALISSLFLAIHKVFLRKSAIIISAFNFQLEKQAENAQRKLCPAKQCFAESRNFTDSSGRDAPFMWPHGPHEAKT